MSIDLAMKKLKDLDKEVLATESVLPWRTRFRRRYLSGRMFWATQVADTYGGIKMAFILYLALGKQVFIAFAHEYAWLVNPIKRGLETGVDSFKAAVEFFHEVV